jgi:hypothetical protein
MQPSVYVTGQIALILIVLGILSMLLYGLRYALGGLRIGKAKRRTLIRFTIAGLILWLTILALVVASGYFEEGKEMPFRLLTAVLPPVIVIIVLLFSKKLRLVLLMIPSSWLIYAQTFRILTELTYWLGYRGGYIPPQMTFEWLNYDIIVGVTAPMAGYVFFGRGRFHRFQAVYWNIFGIALLLNTMVIAIFSMPSSLRVFFTDVNSSFMTKFPFIWIPGFVVPFALALHLFSLKQLFLTKRPQRQFGLRRKNN